MLDLAFIRCAVRDKKFWAGLAGAVLLATGLVLWARRSYQHAQARDGLNTFAPFENPAMDLVFPRVVLMNDAARNILEAGVRERLWTLHARGGNPPAMEVRLTDGGQRWFSVVNNQIIATFKGGTREATQVLELEEIFPSRRVRFRYYWKQFQTASAVLGEGLPEIGKEYEGEALFFYENDQWRLMHWSTPEFDRAVEQFKLLEPAPQ